VIDDIFSPIIIIITTVWNNLSLICWVWDKQLKYRMV